jgi:neutral ceramidase
VSVEKQLLVGTGRADITPPLGVQLRGGPPRIAERVLDPLYATALVLSDGTQNMGLVSCDTLNLPDTFIVEATKAIEDRTGIAAGNMLLAATHTHCGPTLDDPYAKTLKMQICSCVAEACSSLQPCRAGAGAGTVENVAVNQREMLPEGQTNRFGSVMNGDGYDQPVDREVGVVRFDDLEGSSIAALVNFACHPDSSPQDDPTITAQYPGELRRVIESATGATTLFLQGCCGNTGMIGRWFQMARYEAAQAEAYDMTRRVGRRIAGQALQVFESIDTRARAHHRARSKHHYDWVFEHLDIPAVTSFGAKSGRFTPPQFDQKRAEAPHSAEIRVLVLNDIAFVGIPADTYCEIGMEIKQRSRARHTLVLGHANGCLAYIPVPNAYDEGGYSVAAAKSANIGPGTAQIVVDTALDIVDQLLRAKT